MPRKEENLYRRGDTWYGRVTIAGREHRRSLRTTDAREAKVRREAWIKTLERQHFNGRPDAPTFRAAVLRWATEVLPKAFKPQVARRYLTSVASLDKVMGNVPVDEIDGPLIAEYISGRTGEVTNATLRRDLTALSGLLSACAAWGFVTSNVAKNFDRKIIRERRRKINLVREEDYAAALEALPPPLADMLRLLDQTGMRLQEAVSLEHWQVRRDRGQILLDETKTDRPRVIPFVTPAGDVTQIMASRPAGGGFVFCNRNGEPYGSASTTFGQIMRRLVATAAREKADFRRFRIHDLRHMFAIRWLQNGGNIYRLSKQLGHTSVKTTEIYLDYLEQAEQERAKFGEIRVKSESAQKTAQKKSGGRRRPEELRNSEGI